MICLCEKSRIHWLECPMNISEEEGVLFCQGCEFVCESNSGLAVSSQVGVSIEKKCMDTRTSTNALQVKTDSEGALEKTTVENGSDANDKRKALLRKKKA